MSLFFITQTYPCFMERLIAENDIKRGKHELFKTKKHNFSAVLSCLLSLTG